MMNQLKKTAPFVRQTEHSPGLTLARTAVYIVVFTIIAYLTTAMANAASGENPWWNPIHPGSTAPPLN